MKGGGWMMEGASSEAALLSLNSTAFNHGGEINTHVYQGILEDNVKVSVCKEQHNRSTKFVLKVEQV